MASVQDQQFGDKLSGARRTADNARRARMSGLRINGLSFWRVTVIVPETQGQRID